MPDTEKGVATAMSLGGRGAKIARSIDFQILSQPWGLAFLIQRLEQDLGSEVQERQRYALDAYNNQSRGRNTSFVDHVVNYELLLEEAEKAGARFNNVMKSNHLLRTARLTRSEEQWVLQPVAGDLSQYQNIRAALRRLPWHNEGGQQRGPEAYAVHKTPNVHDSEPFNLNQQNRLNSVPTETSQGTNEPSHHFIGDNPGEETGSSSSEGDSDYFSSGSDADSDTVGVWASAWAVHQKHQKKFGKFKKGGSGDRKPGEKKHFKKKKTSDPF